MSANDSARPAGDLAAPSGEAPVGGAAGADQRPLVIPQLTFPRTNSDARERRRTAANRAQLLIARLCSDMPEAARIVQCRRAVCSTGGVVIKRSADGYVYASGVVTCGSPWSCLWCSYKIRAKRAVLIALAVAAHLAAGGGVLFGTFTMNHDRGEKLDHVWGILSDGWAAMIGGRQWATFKEQFGLIGMIRTTEVTHGVNGWHPHIHVLFFIDRPINDFEGSEEYRYFRWYLRNRWIDWFARKQNRDVSQEFGVRFDPVKADESDKIGKYCTKVGYELAMADNKIGRQEGQRHPFAIAHDVATDGDKVDLMLFREWIAGSKRKHSIQWTGKELKALVNEDELAKTDLELAQEEQVGDESLLILESDLWRQLINRPDNTQARFYRVFENGGDAFDALYFLADLGITAEITEDGPLAKLRLNQQLVTNNVQEDNHVIANKAN